MKKFVSMKEINKVFADILTVDYITVEDVTDSMVYLDIHLKTFSVPKYGSPAWMDFNDHCVVLGKLLDRKVDFSLIPTSGAKKLVALLKRPVRNN